MPRTYPNLTFLKNLSEGAQSVTRGVGKFLGRAAIGAKEKVTEIVSDPRAAAKAALGKTKRAFDITAHVLKATPGVTYDCARKLHRFATRHPLQALYYTVGIFGVGTTPAIATRSNQIEVEISPPETGNTLSSFSTIVSTLPKGCEGFRLIKGDVSVARTLIVPEIHELCDVKIKNCVAGFKGNASLSMLFENTVHTQHVLCNDDGARNVTYADLSDDCRGWNSEIYLELEAERFEVQAYTYMNHVLWPQIQVLADKSEKEIYSGLTTIFEKYIASTETNIQYGEYIHREFYNKFIETHPNVSFENFTSKGEVFAQICRIQLNFAKKVVKIAKKDGHFREYNKIRSLMRKNLAAEIFKKAGGKKNYFRETNRFISPSIQSASKRSEKVAVIAGANHVTIRYNKKGEPVNAESVQELYEELDKFKDENPYAILACPDVSLTVSEGTEEANEEPAVTRLRV